MRRRSSVQGGPFMWIAGRQTEVGRDGSGRGSSQRGTAQLGQPDCQLLGDYSKKKPATGGRRMMKFSDECGKMHKLRWIGLPEGLPSAVLARIFVRRVLRHFGWGVFASCSLIVSRPCRLADLIHSFIHSCLWPASMVEAASELWRHVAGK